MPTITGVHYDTQDISGTGQTWIVGQGAEIYSETYGIYEDSVSSGNVLKILGRVSGVAPTGTAVFAHGDNLRIDIAQSALLTGYRGVVTSGDNARITNAGTIDADNDRGIEFSNFGGTGTIVNNGSVSARTGIYVMAAGVSITNAGTILGHDRAIEMVGTGEGHTLANSGRITATAQSGFAVLGSDFDDEVVNSGAIAGRIFLNDGNDRFDFRRGRLSDAVEGGEGDDTLVTTKGGIRLAEQADDGFDTVRSKASYVLGAHVEELVLLGKAIDATGSAGDNRLLGNDGENALRGRAGNDELLGGGGADMLAGGGGTDTFVLSSGSGRDTVADFVDGADLIRVVGFAGIDDPSDVAGRISQNGDDTWVRMSGSDVLVLKDVDASLIDGNDFSFPT